MQSPLSIRPLTAGEQAALELVSDETIRSAIHALGISSKRAKHWISSPDPEYARKKSGATA